MSDSVRPHRWKPTRLLCPWDSPGKNAGVGCICFSSAWKGKGKVKLLTRVLFLATPWTVAYQAPPSMGFPRQEYWSFSFSIFPSKEIPGLISFRMDWLDLLADLDSPLDSQESSPTPQFKSINSLALSFLHSSTLTSIHDHRKNHSLDETDLSWQSNVSAFGYTI